MKPEGESFKTKRWRHIYVTSTSCQCLHRYQTLTWIGIFQNPVTSTLKMESFKSRNVNVTSTFWKADPSLLYSWPAHWYQIQKLTIVNFKVLPKKHLKTSIFTFKTVENIHSFQIFKFTNGNRKKITIKILNQIYFKIHPLIAYIVSYQTLYINICIETCMCADPAINIPIPI